MGRCSFAAALFIALVFGLSTVGRAQLGKQYAVQRVNQFFDTLVGGHPIPASQFIDPFSIPDHDDGVASGIATGFSFDYNGTTFSAINVCVNGWASLGDKTTLPVVDDNSNLFTEKAPGNAIAPYWGDHYYRTNESGFHPSVIQWASSTYLDTNKNAHAGAVLHSFTIEWKNLNINDKTDPNSIATFQLKLLQNPMANDLTTPDSRVVIEFDYGPYGANMGAVIGMEDSLGLSRINGMAPNDSTSKLLSDCWPPSGLPARAIQFIPTARNTGGLPIGECYEEKIVEEAYEPLGLGDEIPDNQFLDSAGFSDHDDGAATGIPADFTFDYNGTTYSTVNICINGWVAPGTIAPSRNSTGNEAFFTSDLPNKVIAPLWGDYYYRTLEPGFIPSRISYLTLAVPDPNPNAFAGALQHTFVAEWNNLNIIKTNPSAIASFQLRIVENPLNNDVTAPDHRATFEFHYGNIWIPQVGVVGIKDSTGSSHLNGLWLTAERNGDSTLYSTLRTNNWPPPGLPGMAIQFVPQGAPPHSEVSIGNSAAEPSLSVQPNPASGELVVRYAAGSGKSQIAMYNILGLQVIAVDGDPSGETTLNTGSLRPGTYSLVLRSGSRSETRSVAIVR